MTIQRWIAGFLALNFALIHPVALIPATAAPLPDLTSLFLEKDSLNKQPEQFFLRNYGDQELISINVLGGVRRPGVYNVPKDTKLTSLLSLAGGLNENARFDRILISGSKQNRIDLEDVIENPEKLDLTLKDQQLVFVEQKRPFINPDVLSTLSAVSIFLSIVVSGLVISQQVRR